MSMYGGPYVDGITCGKGVTKQSFRDECDVNQILDKYQKTGLITHVMGVTPKFGNFATVPTYQAALELVSKAESAFMELPASVRGRFANDPAKLLAFVNDPKNAKEAADLGLIEAISEPKAPEAPEAVKAPVAPKA